MTDIIPEDYSLIRMLSHHMNAKKNQSIVTNDPI